MTPPTPSPRTAECPHDGLAMPHTMTFTASGHAAESHTWPIEAAPAGGLRAALENLLAATKVPGNQTSITAIKQARAALAASPSAAPLDEERLARALRAVDSLPVWREIPDKDNPSVVSVKPDYKATAAAIAAAYSEEGAG